MKGLPKISIIFSGGGMEATSEEEDVKGYAAGSVMDDYEGYAAGTKKPGKKAKKRKKKTLSEMVNHEQ